MKTGVSYMLDKAIKEYETAVEKRVETQIAAYTASSALEQIREFDGLEDDVSRATHHLVEATVADIASAYNLDMCTKLLDVATAVTTKQLQNRQMANKYENV